MVKEKLLENLSKGNINLIDLRIMTVCYGEEYSVTELQRKLSIAYKNLLPHVKKLEGLKFLNVIDQGIGRKKKISTSTKRNVKFFMFGLISLWTPEETLNREEFVNLFLTDWIKNNAK